MAGTSLAPTPLRAGAEIRTASRSGWRGHDNFPHRPAVELPTGTEFRPATSQWIQDRSVELVDRLHPGIQAAASASGTADAIGATPRPTRDLTQAAMRVVASAADFASATAALFTRGAEGTAPSPAIQRLIDARPARNWPSIRAAWSA